MIEAEPRLSITHAAPARGAYSSPTGLVSELPLVHGGPRRAPAMGGCGTSRGDQTSDVSPSAGPDLT